MLQIQVGNILDTINQKALFPLQYVKLRHYEVSKRATSRTTHQDNPI